MGLLGRIFGNRDSRTDEMLVESGLSDDLPLDDLFELDVRGESQYQDALARLAGPKTPTSKSHRVGVTLRCEPTNRYDTNAVRVESMGLLLGYIAREEAAKLAPYLAPYGGCVEGHGLIVGGWKNGSDEGSYGVRVWLTPADARRLQVGRSGPAPKLAPPLPGEERLSPDPGEDVQVSTLTVTCEEHYQDTITATRPADWFQDWWPTLVTFEVVPCNPHAKKAEPCIEVRRADNDAAVGYLTTAMTERHRPAIEAIRQRNGRPTASAAVSRGTKNGQAIWRIKATMGR